tara:strand:+ start:449 stop:799 length:351 start_codon:yes stop_codon:yes gene_type:complete
VKSFLKKNFLNIAVWLLVFPMATLSSEEFIVKDIKIEGLEKISEGALLNYLPVNIGDNLDESRIQESVRSVYSSGFFKKIEFRKDDFGVLIISVLERPSIASINFEGNKDIKTEDL